jgi:hypothetical protein
MIFFYKIGSKDNPYPAVSTKHTDPATHQKIVQILADAQKQQMAAAVAAAAAANMVNFSFTNFNFNFIFIFRIKNHLYHHVVLYLMIYQIQCHLQILLNRKLHHLHLHHLHQQ